MLKCLPVQILVGMALGFLAGLGIGGGSLLMLWLTLVLQVQYPTARAVNLLFFLAAAGSVCVYRLRQGRLPLRSVLPAIVSGCISAALFSWLGKKLEPELVKKIFGVLLLFAGLRELFYRPKKAR